MRMVVSDPKLGSDKELLSGDKAKVKCFLQGFSKSLLRPICSSSVKVPVTLLDGLNDGLLGVFLAGEVRG